MMKGQRFDFFIASQVQKEMNMHKSNVFLATVVCWSLVAVASHAQDTNVYPPVPVYVPLPATKLEVLEANTGKVIVKGMAPVGSVSISGGAVSVTCKEDIDTGSGRKEHGIAITIRLSNKDEDRMIVDYDEVDSLLNAIDYLAKINWSVSSLANFNAYFTTKSGFRIAANGLRTAGTIEFSMRSSRMSKSIAIPAAQLAQFRALIFQAKGSLDSLRAVN